MVNAEAAQELPLDLGHESVLLRHATAHQLRLAALLAEANGDTKLAEFAGALASEAGDGSVADISHDRFTEIFNTLTEQH